VTGDGAPATGVAPGSGGPGAERPWCPGPTTLRGSVPLLDTCGRARKEQRLVLPRQPVHNVRRRPVGFVRATTWPVRGTPAAVSSITIVSPTSARSALPLREGMSCCSACVTVTWNPPCRPHGRASTASMSPFLSARREPAASTTLTGTAPARGGTKVLTGTPRYPGKGRGGPPICRTTREPRAVLGAKDSPLEALRLGQQPIRRGAAKSKHAAEKPLPDVLGFAIRP
jgi:hypothetical protein